MLDLDPTREGATPREAATLVLLRDGDAGVEVFCVERNKKVRFMGGAIARGGKGCNNDQAGRYQTVRNRSHEFPPAISLRVARNAGPAARDA